MSLIVSVKFLTSHGCASWLRMLRYDFSNGIDAKVAECTERVLNSILYHGQGEPSTGKDEKEKMQAKFITS